MSSQSLTNEEIKYFVLFLQTYLTKYLDMRFEQNKKKTSITIENKNYKKSRNIKITINNPIYKLSVIKGRSEDELLDEIINGAYRNFTYLMINKFPNITKKDDSLSDKESDVGVE